MTVLPRLISQNSVIIFTISFFVSSDFTISNNLRYLGGLKKCVIKKFFLNFFDNPSDSNFIGIVEVLDEIIKVNRDCEFGTINPKVIYNNYENWQTKSDIEFFIDFESLDTVYQGNMNIHNSSSITNLVFMMGIGYEENN